MAEILSMPSLERFSFETLACADFHAARHQYPDYDPEWCAAYVTQTSHESGGSIPVVIPSGRIAWTASTVSLPLRWRGTIPDLTTLYVVVSVPTRYRVLRAYFGDCGAVYAALATISAFS